MSGAEPDLIYAKGRHSKIPGGDSAIGVFFDKRRKRLLVRDAVPKCVRIPHKGDLEAWIGRSELAVGAEPLRVRPIRLAASPYDGTIRPQSPARVAIRLEVAAGTVRVLPNPAPASRSYGGEPQCHLCTETADDDGSANHCYGGCGVAQTRQRWGSGRCMRGVNSFQGRHWIAHRAICMPSSIHSRLRVSK